MNQAVSSGQPLACDVFAYTELSQLVFDNEVKLSDTNLSGGEPCGALHHHVELAAGGTPPRAGYYALGRPHLDGDAVRKS